MNNLKLFIGLTFILSCTNQQKIVIPKGYSGPGVVVFDGGAKGNGGDYYFLDKNGGCFTGVNYSGPGWYSFKFFQESEYGQLAELEYGKDVFCANIGQHTDNDGSIIYFIGFSVRDEKGCGKIIPHLWKVLANRRR